ncbi:MAG: hypothetical protein Q8M15_12590 [Bacteroidota bacterium]|nr:hypothetical protein [Bacteroidota bacterium]
MGEILQATRQLQYVAFFYVKVRLRDGFVFMFMAVDAYSGYAINLGIEQDDSDANILKNVYLLTEHKEFIKHMANGFTLVFDGNEQLAGRIESIIKLVNGKVIFNKTYNNYIANDVMLSILEYINKAKG